MTYDTTHIEGPDFSLATTDRPNRFTLRWGVSRYSTLVEIEGDQLMGIAEVGIREASVTVHGRRARKGGNGSVATTDFRPAPEFAADLERMAKIIQRDRLATLLRARHVDSAKSMAVFSEIDKLKLWPTDAKGRLLHGALPEGRLLVELFDNLRNLRLPEVTEPAE